MGSIFSNLLLMTGLSFFLGGVQPRRLQTFNADVAQTMAMFLLLATLSLVIPTASGKLTAITSDQMEAQSIGTAVVVLFSYCLWLYFQLGPDRTLIMQLNGPLGLEKAESTSNTTVQRVADSRDGVRTAIRIQHEDRNRYAALELTDQRVDYLSIVVGRRTWFPDPGSDRESTWGFTEDYSLSQGRQPCFLADGPATRSTMSVLMCVLRQQSYHNSLSRVCALSSAVGGCIASNKIGHTQALSICRMQTHWIKSNCYLCRLIATCRALSEHHRENDRPLMDILVAIMTILFSTALVGLSTEYATNSIQGLLQREGLSRYFVGLVLLPLLSCEPASVIYARADRLDLSISLTLDRCMQTAMMVIPLVILVAAPLKIDMTLQFDSFTIVTVFVSIVILSYVVQEGRSNW